MFSLLLALPLALAQEPPQMKIQGNGSLRHPSLVRAIVITPDSRTAFVGLNDGSLLAYSLQSRQAVEVGKRDFGIVLSLALNRRGDLLAAGDSYGNLRIFDTATLKLVSSRKFKNDDPERIVFHPNGDSLFVAFDTGHLLKLDTAGLATQHDILPTKGSRVLALDCSQDGKTVATADREGNVKLWSSRDLDSIKTWKAHDIFARSLSFEPTGNFLISGGAEGVLKVWKLPEHTLAVESKEFHQESIECIAHAPDGRMITGGHDGLCQFWEGKSYKGLKSYPNYRGTISAIAVSADGRWLVRGGSFLEFAPLDQPEEVQRVAEYGGAILAFAAAPDMKRMVSGGLDRRLIQWKIDNGIISKSRLLDDWITGVQFCRGGDSVAVGLANGNVELYRADSLEPEKSWPAHKGRVTGLAVLDNRVISIGEDGAVHVWSLQGVKQKSFDEKAPCRSIAVRGNRVAVGSSSGNISVYDLAKLTLEKRVHGRPFSVTALAFSRGGSRLLAGYFDGALESFDVKNWSVAAFRPADSESSSILSIDANPKNESVAVGFRNGQASILDVTTLRQKGTVRVGFPAREIFAIRWVLEENSFAAAGATNAVHFYRIQAAGK